MATIGEVYHLPLRQTEGLVCSILKLMGLDLDVPDYTTLCRRREGLKVPLTRRKADEPLHLVVDSSGVKIYGEGEWKALLYSRAKRRRWLKVHVGVDEASGEVVAAVVTGNDTTDADVLKELPEQVEEEIEQVTADKAYDKRKCYKAISLRGARAVIPPRRGAKIWQHGNRKGKPHLRDKNLRRIREVGVRRWKEESGYYRRSKAEVSFFRKKTIFSERVRARRFLGQAAQILVRLAAMNRMTHLGIPESYAV